MKCTNCGNDFEGKFCPECGTPAPRSATCPNCGAEVAGSSVLNAARLLHPIRSHQVLLQKSRPWNFM